MPHNRIKLRSNEGCQKCRLRRKKCDELRPVCGSCARLNLRCAFPHNSESQRAQPQMIQLPSTDTADLQTHVIRAAGGSWKMYLNPIPGYTDDIHRILQYYITHFSNLHQSPDHRPASTLLGLLPLAVSESHVLAALSTVLVAFMPWSPDQRCTVAQRLSNKAMADVSRTLLLPQTVRTLDFTILTAGLLHLSHVRFHRQTELVKALTA